MHVDCRLKIYPGNRYCRDIGSTSFGAIVDLSESHLRQAKKLVLKGEALDTYLEQLKIYKDELLLLDTGPLSKMRSKICVKARWGSSTYGSWNIEDIYLGTDNVTSLGYESRYLKEPSSAKCLKSMK